MASGQIKNTNARMSFIIDKDLKKELELFAEAQDRSVGKIINYAIREYLKNHKDEVDKPYLPSLF